MSTNEVAFAREVFGSQVNYARVWLIVHGFRRSWLQHTAFVLGNRIYFPERWFFPDFTLEPDETRLRFLPVLIHELGHVWQHQHPKIFAYAPRAVWEQLRYGRAVYQYDITAHDRLRDFRIEQQGQILQDFCWRRMQGDVSSEHERVIRADIPAG